MAGSPFVNQLFQLVSNNVGTFLDPFDLIGLDNDMILEDGTSGKLRLVVMGHPGTIDGYDPDGTNAGITNTSAHAGAPDFGFLDTKKGWKWGGSWRKYNIAIDSSEYISADAYGSAEGVLDWLQDPDNLGGDSEDDTYGVDERGWVYVDNEDDDWGLTGNARIIKGNLSSDSISHVYTGGAEIGDPSLNSSFRLWTGIYLSWDDYADYSTSPTNFSMNSYFTTMIWNCNITNFYDTMMSGVSLAAYSHLIGDIPARESVGFWNYATGQTLEELNGFDIVHRNTLEWGYSTVNENIILDYEDVSWLEPRGYWGPGASEPYTLNPNATSWYWASSETKSYHGEIGGDWAHFGGSSPEGEDRPVDTDGYSSPSLKLGFLNGGYTTIEVIDKVQQRYKSTTTEAAEYNLHLNERCTTLHQSLYTSILNKKFTVKMQTSAGLSAEDRIGLTGPTTSKAAEMAVAEHLSATTSPSTSTGMGSSPSSTGPSGYGGY